MSNLGASTWLRGVLFYKHKFPFFKRFLEMIYSLGMMVWVIPGKHYSALRKISGNLEIAVANSNASTTKSLTAVSSSWTPVDAKKPEMRRDVLSLISAAAPGSISGLGIWQGSSCQSKACCFLYSSVSSTTKTTKCQNLRLRGSVFKFGWAFCIIEVK